MCGETGEINLNPCTNSFTLFCEKGKEYFELSTAKSLLGVSNNTHHRVAFSLFCVLAICLGGKFNLFSEQNHAQRH